MFLVDGGPDFNPSHLANALLCCRLFKKLNAYILDLMTYAARYSAFNPVEHLGVPLSNQLSGTVFSLLCEGDRTAPALQSGIDEDTWKEKEKTVFDCAMHKICYQHWHKLKFNSFRVNTKVVPCSNLPNLKLRKVYQHLRYMK